MHQLLRIHNAGFNNKGYLHYQATIVLGDNFARQVVRRHCSLCKFRPTSPLVAERLFHCRNARFIHHLRFNDSLNLRVIVGVNCDKNTPKTENPPLVLLFAGSNRNFHVSPSHLVPEPLKPSSKVEETVTVLKEKAIEQAKEQAKDQVKDVPPVAPVTQPIALQKKTLKQRVVDELLHYYHGFKLLVIDVNVSRKLIWRILQGYQLSRREHKLLVRTVGDVFRMVPFSVFIIVPFMEFLLPFFIKFFPGMLPSTFQTASEKEGKMKQALKVKLEMAKFLQKTLDDMAVSSKGHSSQSAKDFAGFFEKVRTSGEMTTSEEIMKFSKVFEDEITLDSLPRPQLMALCRVLEMNPIGTTNFLRWQLRLKLRSLVADDMMIQREGVDSLSQSELQAACRARGMRALGVSEERLKAQLHQWLDLSLIKKVPPSLLLLSQAFMLPDTISTSEKLAATISALPDAVGTHTKAVIGEREGKVDHKTKIEVIKEEVEKIKEERKEQQEEEKKRIVLKEAEEKEKKEELMVDQAPPLLDKAIMMEPALRAVVQDIKKTSISDRISHDELTTKDLEALETALETIGKDQNKLLVEKEELQELIQEMSEYQEDISELQKITMVGGKEAEVKESRAAQLLFRRVNKMISKMDNLLSQIQAQEKLLKKDMPEEEEKKPPFALEEVLRVEDLMNTVNKLQQNEPDKNRLQRISEVLSKIDADRDGIVRVDSLLKVLEIIGNENVQLTRKQIDELIELIDKEEAIELDDQIVKALNKKREDEEKAQAKTEGKPEGNQEGTPETTAEPKIVAADVTIGLDKTKKPQGVENDGDPKGGAGGIGGAPPSGPEGKSAAPVETATTFPPPIPPPAPSTSTQPQKELR